MGDGAFAGERGTRADAVSEPDLGSTGPARGVQSWRMNPFRWLFGTPPRRGLRHGETAARWAAAYYPEAMQAVAGYVVDMLNEQLGVPISQMKPETDLIYDLGMDELEPVEVLMQIEEDLSWQVAEEEVAHIRTIAGLIEFVFRRLARERSSE